MPPLHIDFTRARPAPPWWVWLLLALGAVGLALAVARHQAAREPWRAAQAALAQADGERRDALAVRGGPAASVSAAPEVLRAAERARAALAQPWGHWMRTLEARGDPFVALLGLDSADGARQLRLVAEAPAMADAVRYVERLRAAPGMARATLVSHERREADGGERIRFSVELIASEAAP